MKKLQLNMTSHSLSPHMLYFAYNKDMGQEDAYDRVLDGQHRKIVKQAFNAMVQSKTPLIFKA